MHTHKGSSSETGNSDEIKLNVYAKVDAKLPERHKGWTPVMVSIPGPSGLAEQRTPIDVVLLLHVHIRFTAPANWHDLLYRATELLLEKLDDNDRLAVVPALLKEAKIIFEDAVVATVKPKLLLMSPENKTATRSAVMSSEAMRSNSPLVRELESAESILYGRSNDDKKQRAGYIVVISNSNEDLSSVLSWRLRSIHAFGFHTSHNASTMYTITSSGDSTYAILDEDDQIAPAFTAIIDKITFAIEPVEIKIKCKEEVLLKEIYAPRICCFISSDEKVGIIWAHARRAGAPTNFIIFLEIPDHYYEYKNLLEVHAKIGHHRPTEVDGDKLPPLIAVSKGMHGSMEVAAEIVRMQALDMVTEITEKHENYREKHKLHDAAQKLCTWLSRLVEESSYGSEAAEAGPVKELAKKMQEMQKRVQEDNFWLECMLSWRSLQWWPLQPLIAIEKDATSGATSVNSGRHYAFVFLGLAPQDTLHRNSLVQLKNILAKVDAIPVPMHKAQRGLPVLVQIVLPSENIEEKQRVPIDLVAVLDVRKESNDRNEQKLKLLNKVMGFVTEKLSDTDRLAIIPVHSTDTQSAAAFFHMSIEGRSECMKVLSVLTSTSRRREQLKNALCLPIAPVSSSTTSVNKLSNSLKDAIKLLDDRDEDDKKSMGLIVVISDSDDTSVCHRTWSSNNYTIHAFSFCSKANARALYRIASRSSGIYGYFDEHCDDITEAFKTCISNITSTIAVNTEVNIACSSSSVTKLSTIVSGHFKSSIKADKKSGSIIAGALYPGAVRKFIVYVKDVREDEYGHLSKILTVNVTWGHEPKEKFDGQMVIVRGKDHGSKVLVREIIRIEEVKIVSDITDPKTKTYDILRKVQELHKRVKVQAADVRKGSNYAFAVDEESLASLASDKDGSWLPYMLSWLSFQGLCEQLPPPPAPTRPRPEIGENLPRLHAPAS
ncbi:unnamed protein product [Urochloa decumbens]|uniref:VWFA domain-containing protein n=1 Tax=Urochloa decumbens TaxID=240449 RepID=A0ABC9CCW4_9POAL